MSKYRPQKRSLTLNGHRTSVSLEEPFWNYFCELALEKNLSLNILASEIDINRESNVGLATAIRVFCLNEARKHWSFNITIYCSKCGTFYWAIQF